MHLRHILNNEKLLGWRNSTLEDKEKKVCTKEMKTKLAVVELTFKMRITHRLSTVNESILTHPDF